MKKKLSRFLCLLFAGITVMSLIPTSVLAATCTHSYTKQYHYQNASIDYFPVTHTNHEAVQAD